MKNIVICLLAFFFTANNSFGQDEGFYLQLSKDTVLAGNVLQISFVANNITGQFEAPDFDGLNIISGPNTSTSMSMINGSVTQRSSYSYSIYCEEIGEVIIPPAYFDTKEGTLETEPLSVIILPNPEGIIEQAPTQSGFFQFNFPEQDYTMKKKQSPKVKPDSKKKKKRKLKKI